MQRSWKVSVTMVGAFAFATALFASGSGRNAGMPIPGAAYVAPVMMGTVNQRPADFGPTGETVSTFHWSAFRPADTSFSITSDLTTVWPTSIGTAIYGSLFLANLQVPEGAVIDFVSFDFCKTNTNATDVAVGASDSVGGDFLDMGVPSVSGCFTVGSASLGYQVMANAGHRLTLFVAWQGSATDGSVRLGGAEVWWHRTVSPAPVTADFLDVPTGDPRFQFIEAIYHAGITAGCGSGNYCPDAPLTRGQMAVFIAKALGLYWPN
jgi:hypothetical protein